jgi:hypothetical protein
VLGAAAPGELKVVRRSGVAASGSAISYRAGQTRANNGILPLDPGGLLGLSCEQASGGVHLLVDVSGYFD